jgi:RloB-like protein
MVLERIRSFVRTEDLRKSDEVWAVVDRDSWEEDHLKALYAWSQEKTQYGFALSNPKFEYWLLLHFQDTNKVSTASDCDQKIMKRLPGYDKHISSQHFSMDSVRKAVERAKRRDTPPCPDWPRKPGTTVYRLVQKILEAKDEAST